MHRALAVTGLLVSILAAAPARAQECGVVDSHGAAALELLEITDVAATMERSIPTIVQAMVGQNPELVELQDVFESFMLEIYRWENICADFVRIYKDAFTEPELRELTGFYGTPVGRKTVTLMPELLRQGMEIGRRRVEENTPELERMITERMKGGPPWEPPDETDPFAVVEGTWDWAHADDRCEANPHTISFTRDRSEMVLTYREPFERHSGVWSDVVRYEIRGSSPGSIRGFMQGETRTTDEGDLVVWDLVLRSPDMYCWRATHWGPAACTKPVVRCGDG